MNMKLGEFIKNFSHNNIIRLVYKDKGGHKLVLDNWDDVSMDHQILNGKGKNRHYIDNEVLGLAGICFLPEQGHHYPEAINIVIEELKNQPFIEEVEVDNQRESIYELSN
jgi:hypothetical protein